MLHAILLASDPVGFSGSELLSNLTPVGMLVSFIVALWRRWLILPRELDERDARITAMEEAYAARLSALEAEIRQFRELAFTSLRIGERAAAVAESRVVGP